MVRQSFKESNGLPFVVTQIVPTPSPSSPPSPSPNPDQKIYVALGDSVAFGLWGFPDYVWKYQSAVMQSIGQPVRLQNLAVNGWTTGHLLAALRTDNRFRNAVVSADYLTWNIGGNDMRAARDAYKNKSCGGADNQDCLRSVVAAMQANWSGIVSEIHSLRSPRSRVRTMSVYNPYVTEDRGTDTWAQDGGLNDFQVFRIYFEQVNIYMEQVVTAQNISFARVYQHYNGANGKEDPRQKDLISFDGFHPNTRGHAVIAQLLTALGF